MFIYNTIPGLSLTYVQLAGIVVGFMGALALGYAVLLEAEKRQDAVFVIGSASLFVYALLKNDIVVMFAGALIFILAGRELIQILRGKHHHTTEQVKKYEVE